jgi:hypothetical protein
LHDPQDFSAPIPGEGVTRADALMEDDLEDDDFSYAISDDDELAALRAGNYFEKYVVLVPTNSPEFTRQNWNRALIRDRYASIRDRIARTSALTPGRQARTTRRPSRSRTVARRASSSRARSPGRLADDPHEPDLTRLQAVAA